MIGEGSIYMPDEEKEQLPQPRLDIIDKIYEKIDNVLAYEAEKHNLTLMEMEILMLYINKKLEHQELLTLIAHDQESSHDFKGTTELYS